MDEIEANDLETDVTYTIVNRQGPPHFLFGSFKSLLTKRNPVRQFAIFNMNNAKGGEEEFNINEFKFMENVQPNLRGFVKDNYFGGQRRRRRRSNRRSGRRSTRRRRRN
jgi:hypothetical protein